MLFKYPRYTLHCLGLLTFMTAVCACAKSIGNQPEVCFNQRCYYIEIAESEPELTRGLMQRSALNEDSGMLFVFDQDTRHGFWMKNTLIPLDIIWMDADYRVVDVARDVLPCVTAPCPVYYPTGASRYVLEVNAGQAEQNNINEGDVAEFRLGAASD